MIDRDARDPLGDAHAPFSDALGDQLHLSVKDQQSAALWPILPHFSHLTPDLQSLLRWPSLPHLSHWTLITLSLPLLLPPLPDEPEGVTDDQQSFAQCPVLPHLLHLSLFLALRLDLPLALPPLS